MAGLQADKENFKMLMTAASGYTGVGGTSSADEGTTATSVQRKTSKEAQMNALSVSARGRTAQQGGEAAPALSTGNISNSSRAEVDGKVLAGASSSTAKAPVAVIEEEDPEMNPEVTSSSDSTGSRSRTAGAAVSKMSSTAARTATAPPGAMNKTVANVDPYVGYRVKSKLTLFFLTGVYVFYGVVMGTYVPFLVPLEAMRMASTWQSEYVILEKTLYGLTHAIAPVVGALSDETFHSWGKRRPWLAGGSLLVVCALTIMYLASSQLFLGFYLFGLAGVMVGKNLVVSCTVSFLADVVPSKLTAVASGFAILQCAVGCLIGFLIQYFLAESAVQNTYVLLLAVFVLISVLFFAFAREPPSDLHQEQRGGVLAASVGVGGGRNLLHRRGDEQTPANSNMNLHSDQNYGTIDINDGVEVDGAATTSTAGDPQRNELATKDRSEVERQKQSEALKKNWFHVLYHALTVSFDYHLLFWVRIFFYSSCAIFPFALFYMRDALLIPDKADAIRVLSTVSILGQASLAVFAAFAGRIVSKAKEQWYLMMTGIVVMAVVYGGLVALPFFDNYNVPGGGAVHPVEAEYYAHKTSTTTTAADGTTETGPGAGASTSENNSTSAKQQLPWVAIHIFYVIALLYGAAQAMFSIGDMALALKLVPANVGNGTAMGIFTPSPTYGFVVGSVFLGVLLRFFQLPANVSGGARLLNKDLLHSSSSGSTSTSSTASSTSTSASGSSSSTSGTSNLLELAQFAGQMPSGAGGGPHGAAGGIADFNGVKWTPEFSVLGHQALALTSFTFVAFAWILLSKVDTDRALLLTEKGMEEEEEDDLPSGRDLHTEEEMEQQQLQVGDQVDAGTRL
ncbi:unnamed protein product [Amoebophrya sp. A120]|nr:unnamed protein product [Amoebophrya sp. A120]|eukprot:GSA120T00001174001.1